MARVSELMAAKRDQRTHELQGYVEGYTRGWEGAFTEMVVLQQAGHIIDATDAGALRKALAKLEGGDQ